MQIGDFVMIGKGSIVCAKSIGSYVDIGTECSSKCVLNQNCKILDNSVVAPDTVIPSFTVYGGKPAVYLGELTEAATFLHKMNAITYYQRMHAKKKREPKK